MSKHTSGLRAALAGSARPNTSATFAVILASLESVLRCNMVSIGNLHTNAAENAPGLEVLGAEADDLGKTRSVSRDKRSGGDSGQQSR